MPESLSKVQCWRCSMQSYVGHRCPCCGDTPKHEALHTLCCKLPVYTTVLQLTRSTAARIWHSCPPTVLLLTHHSEFTSCTRSHSISSHALYCNLQLLCLLCLMSSVFFTGKVPSLEDAYLRKRKLSKDSNPAHEDSAWGSFDPQVAWSASGSSLVTTPRWESATSCDTHTHTGNHSVATIDNVSKPSVDSPSRLSMETVTRSPAHAPTREPVAAADRPALDRTSKTSDDLPDGYAITPSTRLSCDAQLSALPAGKAKKWTKFLTWLTDPDTRDAARAKKSGRPVKRGALYDLANPRGRCPG